MEDDEELGLLLGFAAPISRSCTASFAVRERGLHSEFLKASIVVELEEGDIIDCVDIYKQPAFDNPLLKNHKIQLRPTSFPAQMKNSAPVTDPISETWSKREASPDGTVPIHRTTKDDLVRAKNLAHQMFGYPNIKLVACSNRQEHYSRVLA
ncbi:uncharacterized protein LOC117637338 [Prunus dulcis]|nr:uncharacterized protein LOC117637338 [Prunus dulcis]